MKPLTTCGEDQSIWSTCPDGSLLVSDDFAGAIYRIYYEGK
jgi:hypothetical protein